MANTTNLGLPLIDQNQSQKHVTHNEALRALDAIVHLSVIDDALTAPPGSPADGDRYIVASSPTGAWTGQAGKIAAWQDGAWAFYAPRTGWRCYIASKTSVYVYDGSSWASIVSVLQNLSLLGVGTIADATNPFSAKLNASLWTAKYVADGGTGDLRFTLNKESAAKTVSQLYQSNWSGRAETGLTGDDDFHVKVSPDGAAWKEAVIVDKTSGQPKFPQGVGDGAPFSFRNLLRNASFAINQRAVSGTVTLAAGAYGHDGLRAGASGATYTFATVGVDTQITISAGSLIMPIEAGMIEGGVYTLSQAGAAQARVWQGTGYSGSGSYAACPFQTSGLTANTQTNVEFSTGTILRPQFERGAFATSFERRLPTVELDYCKRYFNRAVDGLPNNYPLGFGAFNNTTQGLLVIAVPTMRVTPTPSIATGSLSVVSSGGTTTSINIFMGGPNLLTLQAIGTGYTAWSPFFLAGNSSSPLTSIDLNAELP